MRDSEDRAKRNPQRNPAGSDATREDSEDDHGESSKQRAGGATRRHADSEDDHGESSENTGSEHSEDGSRNISNSPAETDESSDDEWEWQYTLEDLKEREARAEANAEAEKRRTEPVEPGSPSLEHAAFVLLGVVFTLFILSRLLVG